MNLFVSKLVCRILFFNVGVPQSLDLQKEVIGEQAKLHFPLPIAPAWTIPTQPLNLPNPSLCKKILFHETSPWYQQGWGTSALMHPFFFFPTSTKWPKCVLMLLLLNAMHCNCAGGKTISFF